MWWRIPPRRRGGSPWRRRRPPRRRRSPLRRSRRVRGPRRLSAPARPSSPLDARAERVGHVDALRRAREPLDAFWQWCVSRAAVSPFGTRPAFRHRSCARPAFWHRCGAWSAARHRCGAWPAFWHGCAPARGSGIRRPYLALARRSWRRDRFSRRRWWRCTGSRSGLVSPPPRLARFAGGYSVC